MFYSPEGIVNLIRSFILISIFFTTKVSYVNCAPILLNQIAFNNTINPANFFPTDLTRLIFPRVNTDLFRWWFSSQLAPTSYTRQSNYRDENRTNLNSIGSNKNFGRQYGSNNLNGDMFGDYNGANEGDDFFSQIFSFLFGSPSSGGGGNSGHYGPSNGGVDEQGRSEVNINSGSNSGANSGSSSGSSSGSNSGSFGMTQQEWSQYLQLIQALAQDGDSGGGGGGGLGDAGQLINMAMSAIGGGF